MTWLGHEERHIFFTELEYDGNGCGWVVAVGPLNSSMIEWARSPICANEHISSYALCNIFVETASVVYTKLIL